MLQKLLATPATPATKRLQSSTFFIVRAVDLEKTQINFVFCSLIRNFAQQLIIR